MSAPTATSPIDRVDGDDRAIGTIPRGDALRAGVNFRTAHVFVFDSHGRLLLQRLSSERERHPSRWGSSVAAYLYAGESYEAAARRRLQEELCLDIPVAHVAKVAVDDERSTKFVGLFTATSDRAEICDTDHIAELRFWPLSRLDAVVAERPDQFTPTFIALYEALRA